MKMRGIEPMVAAAMVTTLAGCGGGGGTTPTPPTTAPAPGHPVSVVVFYDENANGALELGEAIRVPDVEVQVGGRPARSAPATGLAAVANVPGGSHAVSVRAETLPPFYRVGAPVTVTVPVTGTAPVAFPLLLPLGRDLRPSHYLAFGDSITRGDGAAQAASYPAKLQTRLNAHFGFAYVNNRGADATNTFEAISRIWNIEVNQPAYTLILYGTNDWHDPVCQENPRCHTVPNLRRVVRAARAIGSLTFVATIPPVNPLLQPQGRNDWIDAVNAQIEDMAREEGAFLVDLNQAFKNQPSLPALFDDHIHPNAAGYEVIANGFFEAIAHGRAVP
jgi:lysophospholipase L1-like esterase